MERETFPYHAQWDITSGCNFRCTFCLSGSGRRKPNELTTDEAKALIDHLHEHGIWFLKIMGGEPFSRADIVPLLRHAAGKQMILSFSTNASLIDEAKADALADLGRSIMYVQMSLYGDGPDTYERVTGHASNFGRAIAGLDRLVARGIEVTILTVATAENVDRLESYYRVASAHGATEFRLTPEVRLGRAAARDHAVERTGGFWSRLLRSVDAIERIRDPLDPEVFVDARPLLGTFLHERAGVRSFYENCSAATSMIYVDPTGKALPCPFLRNLPADLGRHYRHLRASDLTKRTVDEVWRSRSFETVRSFHDPARNLFRINEGCRFFREGTCSPCALTPCGCPELIKRAKGDGRASPAA